MGYRLTRLAAAMTLLGVLGACTTDHSGGPVATATTGRPTTAASPAPTPPPDQRLAVEIKFAQCMRDHGVPTFQDPEPDGSWTGSWLNASDKNALTAVAACDHYLDALHASPSPTR